MKKTIEHLLVAMTAALILAAATSWAASEILWLKLRQHTGVARVVEVGVAPLRIEDYPRDLGQFLRAFDARMRGQYLLQERRAGTR